MINWILDFIAAACLMVFLYVLMWLPYIFGSAVLTLLPIYIAA